MTGSHKFQLMFNALLLNHATFVCVEQAAFPVKPATEHSLRILTAVIDGMRHWSQFKDKVPYLFEIFGELICYPSCALTSFIFIFLKKNTINLTGFHFPLSYSRLCGHSWSLRSKELPPERWEGGCAVCLL